MSSGDPNRCGEPPVPSQRGTGTARQDCSLRHKKSADGIAANRSEPLDVVCAAANIFRQQRKVPETGPGALTEQSVSAHQQRQPSRLITSKSLIPTEKHICGRFKQNLETNRLSAVLLRQFAHIHSVNTLP